MLSLPAGGRLRHRRSRFLSNGTCGFWVHAPQGEESLLDELIRSGQPVGVSFTSSNYKVMFAMPFEQRELKRIDLTRRVPALRMSFPPEPATIHRRTRQAARVPATADVRVRIWQIGERTPLSIPPRPQQEVACELRDISTGGLGLTFHGLGGHPPRLSTDDRLRVELSHPGGMLLVEGRVRHLSLPSGSNSARGGIEFAPTGAGQNGGRPLEQLARIVADLQRQEHRTPRAAAACRGS